MHILVILVNMLAVFVAGTFGSMLKPKIAVSCQRVAVQGCGLLAIGLGGWGIIRQVSDIEAASPEIEGSVLVVCVLVLGGMLGYGLSVQKVVARWVIASRNFFEGERGRAKRRTAKASRQAEVEAVRAENDANGLPTFAEMPPLQTGDHHADGFVLATMLVCSGSLLVTSLLEDGTVAAYVKVGIDALFAFVLGMVYGDGVSLASIPLAAANGLLYAAHTGGKAFVTSCLVKIKADAWEATNQLTVTDAKLAEFEKAVESTVKTWNTEVIAQVSVLAAVIMLAVGVVMAAEKKYRVMNLWPSYLLLYAYQWVVPVITAAIKG